MARRGSADQITVSVNTIKFQRRSSVENEENMTLKPKPKPKPSSTKIKFIVTTLTGKKIEITAEPTDTVKDIKSKIQDSEGIPPEQQRLRFKGELEDHKQIFEYSIQTGSNLILILSLRGTRNKPHVHTSRYSQNKKAEKKEEKELDPYEVARKAFRYSASYEYDQPIKFQNKYQQYKDILVSKGSDFLCIVCGSCDTDTIRYVLDNGGKEYINTKSHKFEYPFTKLCDQLAAKSTQRDIHKRSMQLLVEYGGQPSFEALRTIINDKDEAVFDFILENIANADEFNKYAIVLQEKKTFSELLKRAKDKPIIKKLTDKGAKWSSLYIDDHFNGYSDDHSMADWILTQGVDINERGKGGNTALHKCVGGWVASQSTVNFVIWLLKNGADPLVKNDNNQTALDVASSKWSGSSVQGSGVNPYTLILMELNREIACWGLCGCNCWRTKCCSTCQLLTCICGKCRCSCIPLYCCFWCCLGCCHK